MVSRLFHLEPRGLRTGHVESLCSYIAREATEHGVTTGYIIDKEIAPLLAKPYLNNIAENGGTRLYENSPMLLSIGRAAKEFTHAMERLTMRQDLHQTTMLPLTDIIPARGLICRIRAWCPICLGEMAEGDTYEKLVWSLEAAKVCAVHLCRLESKCPSCSKTMRLLDRKMQPGRCNYCGAWLWATNQVNFDCTRSEVEAAEICMQLVSLGERQASQFSVADFLHEVVEYVSGGNQAAFARLVGVPKNTFSGWYQGHNLVPLKHLVSCMQVSRQSPDVLFNSKSAKINSQKQIICRTNGNNDSKFPSIIYTGGQPLTAVAKKLGVSSRALRLWFPDESRKISYHYIENKRQAADARFLELKRLVEDTTMQLVRSGLEPTRLAVENNLGKPCLLREKKLYKIWKEAVNNYGQNERT